MSLKSQAEWNKFGGIGKVAVFANYGQISLYQEQVRGVLRLAKEQRASNF